MPGDIVSVCYPGRNGIDALAYLLVAEKHANEVFSGYCLNAREIDADHYNEFIIDDVITIFSRSVPI